MNLEELKKKINNIIDDHFDAYEPKAEDISEERKLPEGKRVVRTKSSGDRVYMLDDEKKTRHWVTNPDALKNLGFELTDVSEVGDAEVLKYQLEAAIYRVDPQA